MSTLISCITAFWLSVLTLLISASTGAPWNGLVCTVPVIIVLSIVSTSDVALRFAILCGFFQALLFPSQSPLLGIVLVIVAIGSGALYRAIFSIPSLGALLVTALTGSLLYEAGILILNLRQYYVIGFPDAKSILILGSVRLTASILIVLAGGALYRNIVVRFRQAFIGIRNGI